MKNLKNILWGLILIIVGIILSLNALKITNIDIFFRGWWTLFIIIPCFLDLFTEKNKTANLIGFLIGILLLLACQNIIDFSMIWSLIIPVILIIIGTSIVFKNTSLNKVNKNISKLNNKDKAEYCACFSGQKLDFTEEEFKNTELTAIFGGINCNLKNAKIKQDVVITTCAIFGGIDIYIPNDVNVKVNQTSIFGGVDNKIQNSKDNKKTIYIKANCLFGGVDIK